MNNADLLKKTLEDLISFPTISSTSNLDLIDYLEKLFKDLGFETFRIINPENSLQANLLCKYGDEKAEGLMLSGHTDVVPVKGQPWQTDPFKLYEQEEKYFGRGVVDMKGFIAAVYTALKDFDLSKLKRPLSLLWTYDEENGCHGSKLASLTLDKYFKHLPAYAIIGEPSDMTVMRMHKGHITLKVDFIGKAAHSSKPQLGISAIKMLNGALNELFILEENLKKEILMKEHFSHPYIVMNVGMIAGGNAVNIIPDKASFLLGIRTIPGCSEALIFEQVKDAIIKNNQNLVDNISITLQAQAAYLLNDTRTSLDQVFADLKITDGLAADFATDAGNIAKVGINCYIFGPGSIDRAHIANEWINKNDLVRYGEVLKQVIDKILC